MSAPGWYPDPAGAPGRYRYWDGTRWSTETSDRPGPAPAPTRSRRGLGIAAGVIAVLVVVVLLLVFAVRSDEIRAISYRRAHEKEMRRHGL